MARFTVFGAGAMGTAVAMHAARRGIDTALWANPYDDKVLGHIREEGRHPSLPEHLPTPLRIHGPEALGEAAAGCEVAVMGASSSGARSLSEMVREEIHDSAFVVSLGKGLEPETGKRMSEVYAEELPHATVVAMAGPCLAAELAQGLPSTAVWASANEIDARKAGEPLVHRTFQLQFTDDVIGVEYCTVLKNVAAIGAGLLDGLGKVLDEDFKNAKAALFTKAIHEITEMIVAVGGRAETALGLAGLGDVLVTSLGGRNRLYGELVGAGGHPDEVVRDLERRGMTVEGVESAKDVRRLAEELHLDLPYHAAVERVVFEAADPNCILEVLL
ncbi:MAG: NAD(P)H-dependent glycerol-3-phosphate dehydrogenase [Actinomycetota bacterium]|nr:NAD(P)H-dependent glycerol-3-phosphate dehydrogenase [Actinomycetota bacterium]